MLKEENDALKTTLAKCEMEIKELREENDKKIIVFDKNISEMKSEMEKLQTENEDLNCRILEILNERLKLETLSSEMEQTLRFEIERLESDLKMVQNDSEQFLIKNNELIETINGQNDELCELNEEIGDLEKIIRKKEVEFKDLEKHNFELNEKVEAQNKQIDSLREEKTIQITKLKETEENLNKNICDLQVLFEEKEDQVKKLHFEITELKNELISSSDKIKNFYYN